MVTQYATEVITTALRASDPEEYGRFLVREFIAGSRAPGAPVLTGAEQRMYAQALSSEDAYSVLTRAVERRASNGEAIYPARNYCCLVMGAMVLCDNELGGALGWVTEAYRVPIESGQDAWWAIHGAILGLCICVARTRPEKLRPFNGREDGAGVNDVLEFLGTYAGFMQKAVSDDLFDPHRELVQIMSSSSAALYHALELKPNRVGPMQRWQDAWQRDHMDEESRQFLHSQRRDRALEEAQLVDDWTDRAWRFRDEVEQIARRWSLAYRQLEPQ